MLVFGATPHIYLATALFLLSLVRDGHLTATAARDIIDEMIEGGWYRSTDLYSRIVWTLE